MQKNTSPTWCGIDYGSKLAGTTAVCACQADTLRVQVWQSASKQDADAFLQDWLEAHQPALVFIDAPLSLPKLYKQAEPSAEDDFFYRKGDRELGAMSPLFLGGLTARAMRLQALVRTQGIVLYETYPAQQAARLKLGALGYKKDSKAISAVLAAILNETPFEIDTEAFDNWHRIDALLALTGAYRYAQGQAKAYGETAEGQIWI